MKRGICSNKKEPFVPLLSEFTQERATPSAELNPYNPFPLKKTGVKKNMATNTPVMEVQGAFSFLYITTVFLGIISPTSHPGLWTGTWVCLSGLYTSFQSSSPEYSVSFLHLSKVLFLKCLVWTLISWIHLKLLQDQQWAKTLLEVSSQMLVCKGEDLYRIFLSPVRSVHMESSYSKTAGLHFPKQTENHSIFKMEA